MPISKLTMGKFKHKHIPTCNQPYSARAVLSRSVKHTSRYTPARLEHTANRYLFHALGCTVKIPAEFLDAPEKQEKSQGQVLTIERSTT